MKKINSGLVAFGLLSIAVSSMAATCSLELLRADNPADKKEVKAELASCNNDQLVDYRNGKYTLSAAVKDGMFSFTGPNSKAVNANWDDDAGKCLISFQTLDGQDRELDVATLDSQYGADEDSCLKQAARDFSVIYQDKNYFWVRKLVKK